jgi:hypothetical protein
MPRFSRFTKILTPAAALALGATLVALAGPLDPPAGPVAPTFKTLSEVEPRTAINLANTPGDADSLFRITQPGSYYLTGDVTGVTAKHGIQIAASNVTIDLMGFHLNGVAGSLSGIHADAGAGSNLTVCNGTVRAWGANGLSLFVAAGSNNLQIRQVHALNNAAGGIVTGSGSPVTTIADCVASSNAFVGISTGESAVVTNSIANLNGQSGILVQFGSVVSHCIAADNGDDGIGSGGGVVSECSAHSNQQDGIRMVNSGTISNCSALNNFGDGIEVTGNCLVLENTCRLNGSAGNTAAGIHATGNNSRIEGNNCIANDVGIDVDGTANLIVRNSTNGNATAFAIVAGNTIGGIIAATTNAAAISGSSASGTIGTTDPWSNIAY